MAKRKQYPKVLLWFDDWLLDELKRDEITDEDRCVYSTLILRPEHNGFPKSAPKTDHCSQEQFATLVGLDPSRISRMLARRVLTPALPWRIWVIQYISYMKGLAAGRRGSGY